MPPTPISERFRLLLAEPEHWEFDDWDNDGHAVRYHRMEPASTLTPALPDPDETLECDADWQWGQRIPRRRLDAQLVGVAV